MPTLSRTPVRAPWAPYGSAPWRRLVPALRGVLLMALVLCAVVHGVSGEAHGPVSLPAASSAMAVTGDPHGPHVPHVPHGVEDCATDVIIRTAAQSTDDLPLAAMALVVLVAVSVAASRPLARPHHRRRRSARTGRAALVRTSRWRI